MASTKETISGVLQPAGTEPGIAGTAGRVGWSLAAGISRMFNGVVYVWENLGEPMLENGRLIIDKSGAVAVQLMEAGSHYGKILMACIMVLWAVIVFHAGKAAISCMMRYLMPKVPEESRARLAGPIYRAKPIAAGPAWPGFTRSVPVHRHGGAGRDPAPGIRASDWAEVPLYPEGECAAEEFPGIPEPIVREEESVAELSTSNGIVEARAALEQQEKSAEDHLLGPVVEVDMRPPPAGPMGPFQPKRPPPDFLRGKVSAAFNEVLGYHDMADREPSPETRVRPPPAGPMGPFQPKRPPPDFPRGKVSAAVNEVLGLP